MRFFFLLTLLFGLSPLVARAAEAPITVTVRIETEAATLFSGSVTVTDCMITPVNGPPQSYHNHEAVCALEAAALEGSFSYRVVDQGLGLYVTTIAGTSEDYFSYWFYWVNNSLAPVGVDSFFLNNNDAVVFALTQPEAMLLTLRAEPQVLPGTPFPLQVVSYVGGEQDWVTVAGATVSLGSLSAVTNTNGEAIFSVPDAGSYEVVATKAGSVRSARQTLTVLAPVIPAPQLIPPENPQAVVPQNTVVASPEGQVPGRVDPPSSSASKPKRISQKKLSQGIVKGATLGNDNDHESLAALAAPGEEIQEPLASPSLVAISPDLPSIPRRQNSSQVTWRTALSFLPILLIVLLAELLMIFYRRHQKGG